VPETEQGAGGSEARQQEQDTHDHHRSEQRVVAPTVADRGEVVTGQLVERRGLAVAGQLAVAVGDRAGQ